MASNTSSRSIRRLSAELFVIVAGVLIALAIDEWRGNIENARLEHEYIQQLINDLRVTESSVIKTESDNVNGEISASRLLSIFAARETVDSDELVDLIFESSIFYNPVPVLGTIEALVTTGDLRLIQDPATRSAIPKYLSYNRDFLLAPIYDSESRFRSTHDRMMILAATHGIVPKDGVKAPVRIVKPNVEAFLADNQAYVAATILVRVRAGFTWYREELEVTANELRKKLEKLSD